MRTDREWNRRTGLVAALLLAEPAIAATVSLMAVGRNDVPIDPPVTTITAFPGDTIEAEIFVSDWAMELPEGIRSFNLVIDGVQAATSGTNGLVLPLGWASAVTPLVCAEAAECDVGEVCESSVCRSPDHDPTLGAFVDTSRADYLLFGLTSVIGDVNTSSLRYAYFDLAFESAGAKDTGEPKYAGTLILEVSPSACGTFVVRFAPCGESLLGSTTHEPVDPFLVPLVIQLQECPVIPIAATPENCAIDARIPHVPGDPASPLGWSSMALLFDDDPTGLQAGSFRARVVPIAAPPSLTGVVADAEERTLTIGWDPPIATGRWTCFEHRASQREACLALLPGDVNQDRVVGPDDVQALIENLRRRPLDPSRPLYQCDTDRSGVCSPLDFIAAMDLLNGGGFETWHGAAIAPHCPSPDSLDPRLPTGACCNQFGGCADDTAEGSCSSAQQTWVHGAACCAVPCADPLGACCDTRRGTCEDGVVGSNCQRISDVWTQSAACSEVACAASVGACCNLDAGTCRDSVMGSGCDGPSESWRPGALCSDIVCVPG